VFEGTPPLEVCLRGPSPHPCYPCTPQYKSVGDRAAALSRWREDGGLLLMGYEMYRSLVQSKSGAWLRFFVCVALLCAALLLSRWVFAPLYTFVCVALPCPPMRALDIYFAFSCYQLSTILQALIPTQPPPFLSVSVVSLLAEHSAELGLSLSDPGPDVVCAPCWIFPYSLISFLWSTGDKDRVGGRKDGGVGCLAGAESALDVGSGAPLFDKGRAKVHAATSAGRHCAAAECVCVAAECMCVAAECVCVAAECVCLLGDLRMHGDPLRAAADCSG
jgi:hypothetical protein